MKNKLYHLYRTTVRWIRRQLRNPRKKLILGAIAVTALLVVILSMFVPGKKPKNTDLKDGVSYIKSQEKKDTSKIEQEIKAIERRERKEALESGKINVWQQFNDSVVLGDSRAVGFEVYQCIDESRVLADAGATIRKIPEYLEDVKKINPSTIILCFGLNDISIGIWPTCEEYITELDKMIDTLKKEVPGSTVFVNSTIPATDPAFQKSEKWREIPNWNAEIKAHCEENKIPYIDVSETVEEHKDLYDVDGIHMRKDFYKEWAVTIITEVTEYE